MAHSLFDSVSSTLCSRSDSLHCWSFVCISLCNVQILSIHAVSVQKACFVLDAIRGKDVTTALGILTYNPRYASSIIKKLLESAIANAENNNGMSVENLYIEECYANKGPTMKRIKPRAQGRAYRIEKRMSHITIVLNER